MKVFHVSMALVATVILFLILSFSAFANICGDINNDGAGPDISDLLWLVDYMFQDGPPPPQLYSADINGDFVVDISDVIFLVDYSFSNGPDPVCNSGTVTDIDGNVYRTVKIGGQWWMAENLKVTHYRNGDTIPNVTYVGSWGSVGIGAYCNYDNDENLADTYGRLYNWFAVADGRNIAPTGWHVPSADEWKQMQVFLGISQAGLDTSGWLGTVEGGKLKEAGTGHWLSPNTGATDEIGFSALPGGFRDPNGFFNALRANAIFWSSTALDDRLAWYLGLTSINSGIFWYNHLEPFGFSVRCVQD
jgi:uncharacterized protein (TIGR02145 family)